MADLKTSSRGPSTQITFTVTSSVSWNQSKHWILVLSILLCAPHVQIFDLYVTCNSVTRSKVSKICTYLWRKSILDVNQDIFILVSAQLMTLILCKYIHWSLHISLRLSVLTEYVDFTSHIHGVRWDLRISQVSYFLLIINKFTNHDWTALSNRRNWLGRVVLEAIPCWRDCSYETGEK